MNGINRLGKRAWVSALSFYMVLLELAEVLIGSVVEGVVIKYEGIQQLGVQVGHLLAKALRVCRPGMVLRKIWDRFRWIWGRPTQPGYQHGFVAQ